MIATSSDDHKIQLWETGSGKLLKTLSGHFGSVNSVVFSPDGLNLLSTSADLTVRLWDVGNATAITILEDFVGHLESVAFSPDGNQIAAAGHDLDYKVVGREDR